MNNLLSKFDVLFKTSYITFQIIPIIQYKTFEINPI